MFQLRYGLGVMYSGKAVGTVALEESKRCIVGGRDAPEASTRTE